MTTGKPSPRKPTAAELDDMYLRMKTDLPQFDALLTELVAKCGGEPRDNDDVIRLLETVQDAIQRGELNAVTIGFFRLGYLVGLLRLHRVLFKEGKRMLRSEERRSSNKEQRHAAILDAYQRLPEEVHIRGRVRAYHEVAKLLKDTPWHCDFETVRKVIRKRSSGKH